MTELHNRAVKALTELTATRQAAARGEYAVKRLIESLDAAAPPPPPAETPPPAPAVVTPGEWTADATRDYYQGVLQRPWRNPGAGDWVDATGAAQGPAAFAQATVSAIGAVRIPVGDQRDFYIAGSTRLVDVAAVALEVGGISYAPAAETHLAASSVKAQADVLPRKPPILARFGAPAGSAVLVITVAKVWSGGAGTVLSVFKPSPRLVTAARPAWVKPDPAIILDVPGGITRTLQPNELTWHSKVHPIEPQEVAFLTVFLKLHDDFAPGDSGKLPGLANTGQAARDANPTGWGGRQPDGIHWSARTGYGGFTDLEVALRTYFYAMAPHDLFGWIDPTGFTLPKGRWTAYVQGVRLNTPGVADGALFYWLAGAGDVYARDDIRWRTDGGPLSLVREAWVDFYCGGTSNGGAPSTISVGRATVTRGMPDTAAIEGEVARLNAG